MMWHNPWLGLYNILVVPEITQGPIDAARRIGESVMFTCNATGVPLPNITWRSDSNDTITPQSDEVTDDGMVRQSQIMLSNLQLGDFEIYTCTATNEFDSDSEMALLQCEMIIVSEQDSLAGVKFSKFTLTKCCQGKVWIMDRYSQMIIILVWQTIQISSAKLSLLYGIVNMI